MEEHPRVQHQNSPKTRVSPAVNRSSKKIVPSGSGRHHANQSSHPLAMLLKIFRHSHLLQRYLQGVQRKIGSIPRIVHKHQRTTGPTGPNHLDTLQQLQK